MEHILVSSFRRNRSEVRDWVIIFQVRGMLFLLGKLAIFYRGVPCESIWLSDFLYEQKKGEK